MGLSEDIQEFSDLITRYSYNKAKYAAEVFEFNKKNITKAIIKRRGQLSRPTVHLGMVSIVASVLIGGSLIGSTAKNNAGQYPAVEAATPQQIPETELAAFNGGALEEMSTETIISEKPRDQIIEHEVKSGETLSKIAQQYNINVDTIKWANEIENTESIKPGQKLKILPVIGVAHKVVRNDTVYSIAKKYDTNPQGIVDFPFNDIGENLTLRIGQIIIVPDGTPPEKPRPTKTPAKVIQGPTSPYSGTTSQQGDGATTGSFIWPARGIISQGFKSYHTAIDIAGSQGDPVVAADGGEVIISGWVDNSGYGNRIMIKHTNGYITLYAHLQANSNKVKAGDKVSKGQVIGLRGSTGRSTGPHLHFEVRRQNGGNVNPLNLLK